MKKVASLSKKFSKVVKNKKADQQLLVNPPSKMINGSISVTNESPSIHIHCQQWHFCVVGHALRNAWLQYRAKQ